MYSPRSASNGNSRAIRERNKLEHNKYQLSRYLRMFENAEDKFFAAYMASAIGTSLPLFLMGTYGVPGTRSTTQSTQNTSIDPLVPIRVPIEPPIVGSGPGSVIFDDPWQYADGKYPVGPARGGPKMQIVPSKDVLKSGYGPSFSMGTSRNPKNRARKGRKSKQGTDRKTRAPLYGSARALRMRQDQGENIVLDRSSLNMSILRQTPMHTVLGKRGIVISGKQPFYSLSWTTATADVLTDATLATRFNANRGYVSPDIFNGPLAAQANLYDHYVFRKIRFEYISTTASSQAGALVMATRDDPFTGSFTPSTFSNIRALTNSATFPMRESRAVIEYTYNGTQVWSTLADTASTAGIRSSMQAEFLMAPDGVNAGATTSLGYVNVYYVIELYCPGITHGFTAAPPRDYKSIELREVKSPSDPLKVDQEDLDASDVSILKLVIQKERERGASPPITDSVMIPKYATSR